MCVFFLVLLALYRFYEFSLSAAVFSNADGPIEKLKRNKIGIYLLCIITNNKAIKRRDNIAQNRCVEREAT